MTDSPHDRAANLLRHQEQLQRMLDSPAVTAVEARVWRTHYWLDDELLSVQLTHYTKPQPPDGAIGVVRLTRGYQPGVSDHVAFLRLPARYRVVDAVAFLRLDRVDPALLVWEDVTNYRALLTVAGLLPSAQGSLND